MNTAFEARLPDSTPTPSSFPDHGAVLRLIVPQQSGAAADIPDRTSADARPVTAAGLVRQVLPLDLETSNEKLLEIFNRQPELQAVPVVDGDIPVGIISRHAIVERFAPLFRLHGEKAYACFMDAAPVVVEGGISLQELCRILAAAGPRHLANGFIVTEQGRYIGMGVVPDLIHEIAELMEG